MKKYLNNNKGILVYPTFCLGQYQLFSLILAIFFTPIVIKHVMLNPGINVENFIFAPLFLNIKRYVDSFGGNSINSYLIVLLPLHFIMFALTITVNLVWEVVTTIYCIIEEKLSNV